MPGNRGRAPWDYDVPMSAGLPCVQLAEVRLEDVSEDTTAAEWFQGRCHGKLAPAVLPLLDAFYANDLCSDLQSLGAAEAAWEARQWRDGEDTLVKGGTMAPLTATLARGVPIRLGTPVREVRWRPQAATWSAADAARSEAAAVEVVSVHGEVWPRQTLSATSKTCLGLQQSDVSGFYGLHTACIAHACRRNGTQTPMLHTRAADPVTAAGAAGGAGPVSDMCGAAHAAAEESAAVLPRPRPRL